MTADLVPIDNMAALDAMDPVSREVAVTRMLDEARGWRLMIMAAPST